MNKSRERESQKLNLNSIGRSKRDRNKSRNWLSSKL